VLVNSGATGGRTGEVELGRLFRLNLRIAGTTMGTREELAKLIRFCVEQDLRPEIDTVAGLEDAPAQIGRMWSGDVRGKIVLKP
jgi:D-arabinose 1-dehydrogenase-like Zn-dependent alcohol dehydrogenase